jgi:hypothetical protein
VLGVLKGAMTPVEATRRTTKDAEAARATLEGLGLKSVAVILTDASEPDGYAYIADGKLRTRRRQAGQSNTLRLLRHDKHVRGEVLEPERRHD